jgi:hypothetical protein
MSMFVATGMFLFLLMLSQHLDLFVKRAHIDARPLADLPRVHNESSEERRQ